MSWGNVALGDICDLQNGYAFKSSDYVDTSNTLSCRMSNIRPGGVFDINYNARYLPDDFIEKHKQFLLKDGDVIIAMTDLADAPKILGVPTVVETNGKNILLNQRVGKLVIKNENYIHFPYLKLALNYPKVRSIYKRFAGGGLQINLGKADLLSVEIPLPYPDDPEKSLKEQKRIAAILDKADGIRRKRQQAIQLADDFLRSVFLDMFGDPVTNPKGWDTGNFGEVIQTLTDYHANGSYETLNDNVTLLDNPDYAYMVRTTDLQKNDYTENVKYISESAYHHLSKSKVFGGEIIINKIGSAGSVYLMPKLNRPVSLAMNQFLIRCKEGESNTFYYYLLKTKSGERELKKRTQGAVTKTITKNAIREVPVIMPPNDIQCKFLGVVAQVTKKLNEGISASSIKVEDVFYSLSQKAFKGEL